MYTYLQATASAADLSGSLVCIHMVCLHVYLVFWHGLFSNRHMHTSTECQRTSRWVEKHRGERRYGLSKCVCSSFDMVYSRSARSQSRWLQASCIEQRTCTCGTGAMVCRKPASTNARHSLILCSFVPFHMQSLQRKQSGSAHSRFSCLSRPHLTVIKLAGLAHLDPLCTQNQHARNGPNRIVPPRFAPLPASLPQTNQNTC